MATKRSSSTNILPYLIYFTEANEKVNQKVFDSDPFIVSVGNHASKTISNQSSHLISDFFPLPRQHIKGISVQISIKGRGTVRWKIEDDEGRVHTLDIKDTLYVPESPISIICPQYWAQYAKDDFSTRRGKYMANFDYEFVLYCNQRRYKCSVSWDLTTNTGHFLYAVGDYLYLIFTAAM